MFRLIVNRRNMWILPQLLYASILIVTLHFVLKLNSANEDRGFVNSGFNKNKVVANIDLDRKETICESCNVFKQWTHSESPLISVYKGHSDTIDYQAEMDKLNKDKVAADDPRLIELIRKFYIELPSYLPYNLSNAADIDASCGQAPFVDSRMGYKENGFYVESGAHDGEYLSNTLFFERMRKWNGVLIEPLPTIFQQMQNKHRKAYSINACLSRHPYPSKELLTDVPVLGRIIDSRIQNAHRNGAVSVQCLPLYSILLALNQTSVDFLSLDVEGVEHNVLETIPWDRVDINMMAIEYDKWPGGQEALRRYMEGKGYTYLMQMKATAAADLLFKKKNFR